MPSHTRGLSIDALAEEDLLAYFQSLRRRADISPNPSWPDQRRRLHASSEPVNWQPISQMPLVASMIDGALSGTHDHIQTLTKARAQPHVLDDATIDRIERVHGEQLEFVDIYAEQIQRWRTEGPSAAQTRELDLASSQ